MASKVSYHPDTNPFEIHEDSGRTESNSPCHSETGSIVRKDIQEPEHLCVPLLTTKLENIQPSQECALPLSKIKLEHSSSHSENASDTHQELLAKLSQTTRTLQGQAAAFYRAKNSVFNTISRKTSGVHVSAVASADLDHERETNRPDMDEFKRLQQELDDAKQQIAKKDQELSERAVGNISNAHRSSPNLKGLAVRRDLVEEQSDVSETPTNWTRPVQASDSVSQRGVNPLSQPSIWAGGPRSWSSRNTRPQGPQMIMPIQAARNFPTIHGQPVVPGSPYYTAPKQYHSTAINRSRPIAGGCSRTNPWANITWPGADLSNVLAANAYGPLQPMGAFQAPQSPNPLSPGTTSNLSAMAPEFILGSPQSSLLSGGTPGQPFLAGMEPVNYRKLLDRNVSCNWDYIVDKIIRGNDQQASIFLQQKLKLGTAEQKYEIVEAIVAQAYPLMINRFGNFLVQRCFEHGTPEQVVAIAKAIRGKTLSLSMDAFGCHVVQKAFDAVPEEYKAIMVHELLRRIPETVIHRYACHVWQKLFELRWSDSPPQIMKYVNEALCGMWHEVALGETGSLVVQNIFENCLEEDKRPCIEEVLASIDIVAHGQFGNWCIQHICEHGAQDDRTRAIDHVLRYATEYSMDQFASKVIEKCLKIGRSDFLERYLERVCEGRPDRPRIPLIDIASDQYGNYLVQYILTNASAQHREVVATHIRKHMVSLRGSKFGSRVGLLCCNPAYATRPGPAIPVSSSRFAGSNNTPIGGTSTRFNPGSFN